MSAPYVYDDAHNHRLTIAATTDGLSQQYVSLGADCMDIGGDMANVWLPVPDAERLLVALAERVPFEHTDHVGDSLTVAPAPDWTTFTVVRAAREDGDVPVTVRVVVLSARLGEVRAGVVAVLPVPVGPEPQAPAEVFVPRTERSYWVDIAAALNAAHSAGMPVGIDLDGTLTDRNAWSVVWDRAAEQWVVAGYEDDADEPDAVTRSFVPVASLREDVYESPLHHTYRVGHDLPETGGAK